MSTTTTPSEAVQKASTPLPPRKPKIPTLNPYMAPAVICPNRECLKVLFPKVTTEKGGEPTLQYDCEPCSYSFFASLVHAQGTCKPLGSQRQNPPEVMQKG